MAARVPLGVGGSLTVYAQRDGRIRVQPFYVDLFPAELTAAVHSIQQSILRIVYLSQAPFQLRSMPPFDFAVAADRAEEYPHAVRG